MECLRIPFDSSDVSRNLKDILCAWLLSFRKQHMFFKSNRCALLKKGQFQSWLGIQGNIWSVLWATWHPCQLESGFDSRRYLSKCCSVQQLACVHAPLRNMRLEQAIGRVDCFLNTVLCDLSEQLAPFGSLWSVS